MVETARSPSRSPSGDEPLELRLLSPGAPGFDAVRDWLMPQGGAAELVLEQGMPHSPAVTAPGAVLAQAHRGGRTAGAILAWIRPDHTADGVPPRIDDRDPQQTAALLLCGLGEELRRRGVALLSIYLAPERAELAGGLLQAGFQRSHDLLILVAHTCDAAEPPLPRDWRILPYNPRQRRVLGRVLTDTFSGSWDFPDLDLGVPAEAVLKRFSQSGSSADRLWHLVEYRGHWAGCVLLADQPDCDRCQLVYMGLAPAVRGRGGGLLMARFACWRARQIGRGELVLGVDSANDPALAVYAAAGWVQGARRAVWFQRIDAGLTASCFQA